MSTLDRGLPGSTGVKRLDSAAALVFGAPAAARRSFACACLGRGARGHIHSAASYPRAAAASPGGCRPRGVTGRHTGTGLESSTCLPVCRPPNLSAPQSLMRRSEHEAGTTRGACARGAGCRDRGRPARDAARDCTGRVRRPGQELGSRHMQHRNLHVRERPERPQRSVHPVGRPSALRDHHVRSQLAGSGAAQTVRTGRRRQARPRRRAAGTRRRPAGHAAMHRRRIRSQGND